MTHTKLNSDKAFITHAPKSSRGDFNFDAHEKRLKNTPNLTLSLEEETGFKDLYFINDTQNIFPTVVTEKK